MRGMIAVDDVIASLPKDRQKKIAARGNELLAKVQRRMTLSEIRKGRKISQAKMAEALGIGQMQISRLEKRRDPRLSTIQRTVAAMGGHLTMIATFPDQEPVILVTSQFMDKPSASAKKPGAPRASDALRPSRSLSTKPPTKPSWLPICFNGCTKRFHVGRIPLRMPHRPHTLSKLLDKCRIRCGIRQMWHDIAERRQDEPVSRRGKDCFRDVFDSEVLLQPRIYGRKIVMRHGHQ